MALLNDEIVKNVTDMLAGLPRDVRLAIFTNDEECEYCPQILQLAEEVAATSPRVSVETYEIHKDRAKAQELGIEMAPAIAILGEKDYGMRFFGIPSGYEFTTLLHGIQKASHGESELDASTLSFLGRLDQPVLLQVFVTPTCPYCPRSAIVAMEMAVASEHVRAEIVESAEFPELANRFNVMGVPLNVVNGKERVEGAAPPNMIVAAIERALA